MVTGLLTIKLEGLRFYAYHGLYPQERKIGGEYQVDLQVDKQAIPLPVLDLSQTLDYVQLYKVVKEEMMEPRDLLETLAMTIVQRIAEAYPCQRIAVEIKKFTVPIEQFTGNTAVCYEWKA